MRKDPTLFRERYKRWKAGEKVYDAGKTITLPEVIVTPDLEYNGFLNTLPDNQKYTPESKYTTHRYWELNGKPKNFKEAKQKGMYTLEEDGLWHAPSVLETPDGNYEWMKPKTHSTAQKELDWYNSKEGALFKKQFELVDDPNRQGFYKYQRRLSLPKFEDGVVPITQHAPLNYTNELGWGDHPMSTVERKLSNAGMIGIPSGEGPEDPLTFHALARPFLHKLDKIKTEFQAWENRSGNLKSAAELKDFLTDEYGAFKTRVKNVGKRVLNKVAGTNYKSTPSPFSTQCAYTANRINAGLGRPTSNDAWTRYGIYGDSIIYDAAKSDKLMNHYLDLLDGDIVDMKNKTTTHLKEADAGRGNSHTGTILKDLYGRPYVVHNLGSGDIVVDLLNPRTGKLHPVTHKGNRHEDMIKTQDARSSLDVTRIARPGSKNKQYPYSHITRTDSILNPYYDSYFKRQRLLEQTFGNDPEAWNKYKTYLSGLKK